MGEQHGVAQARYCGDQVGGRLLQARRRCSARRGPRTARAGAGCGARSGRAAPLEGPSAGGSGPSRCHRWRSRSRLRASRAHRAQDRDVLDPRHEGAEPGVSGNRVRVRSRRAPSPSRPRRAGRARGTVRRGRRPRRVRGRAGTAASRAVEQPPPQAAGLGVCPDGLQVGRDLTGPFGPVVVEEGEFAVTANHADVVATTLRGLPRGLEHRAVLVTGGVHGT